MCGSHSYAKVTIPTKIVVHMTILVYAKVMFVYILQPLWRSRLQTSRFWFIRHLCRIKLHLFLSPPSNSLWDTAMRCWTWSSWVKMTATLWWPPTAASWRCLICSPTVARSCTGTQVSDQQGAVCAHMQACSFVHLRPGSFHSVSAKALPQRKPGC